jgi:hypothetical protein
MTKEEQLKAIIKKAEKGGWDLKKVESYAHEVIGKKEAIETLAVDITTDAACEFLEPEYSSMANEAINVIIFSHDFLKAYFGEEGFIEYYEEGKDIDIGKAWAVHATRLVLSEDRIEYLAKYL